VLVFAGALSAAEWVRGHLLTGFPWNLPGESWAAGSAPSQAAALTGAYGLSWITIAIAAAPAVIFDPAPRRTRASAMGAALAGLIALYGAGAVRLADTPPPSPAAPLVRVVQANIDQKEKWRSENLDQIFTSYLDLTRRPGPVPDVVVWPEGALPAVIDDLLSPGSIYAERLTMALAPGQTLMMGANRAGLRPDGEFDYFNALVALRREPGGLKVTGLYDKYRLVPFGEFLPLGGWATRLGVRSLVHMPEDFSAGPLPRPITPEGLPPVQPLICYEALFPGMTRQAAQRAGRRPAWIVNVSNDAWFGVTSGPPQHLNLASYRAIEEGLPIVRATPTGVSAVIDAFGRTLPGARLGLTKAGIIDARLPAALEPTPYDRFGDLFFAGMLLVSAVAAAARRRIRRLAQ
jgi:apolipoprotein N-acyltransferase